MILISIWSIRSANSKNNWAVDRPTGLTTDGNSLKIAVCIGELF